MRKYLSLAIGVALLCGASAMAADDVSVAEMKATIDALQSRLDQLEGKMDQDWKIEMAKVARELAADASAQSAVPSWLDNLTMFGDLRLRYQNDCADDDASGYEDTRRKKMRNRLRFRLRWGIIKTWMDGQLEVGFRLASGEAEDESSGYLGSSPTSANQTFTDGFSQKPIWIDRVWATYRPSQIPGLLLTAGKIANPLVHTDMIWDPDVNPEGVVLAYSKAFGNLTPFGSFGYFSINENTVGTSGDGQYDHILMSYQTGVNWQVNDDVKTTFAATYYDFDHSDAWISAGEFQMINLLGKVGFNLFDLPWSVYIDYVHNCKNGTGSGENQSQDDGLAIGVKVGKNEKKGDWSAAYKWAYVETFCTPSGIVDSEWGGTNSKGHSLWATYNLTDFLKARARIYFLQGIADSLDGVEMVTTQFDLFWSF